MAGGHPTDIRRKGRRLLEKLEGINLNEPLAPGLHAQLCQMARDLADYKSSELTK